MYFCDRLGDQAGSRLNVIVELNFKCVIYKTRLRGYKTFFMLNSVEHEILNAHKYKNIKKFGLFRVRLAKNAIFSAHKC